MARLRSNWKHQKWSWNWQFARSDDDHSVRPPRPPAYFTSMSLIGLGMSALRPGCVWCACFTAAIDDAHNMRCRMCLFGCFACFSGWNGTDERLYTKHTYTGARSTSDSTGARCLSVPEFELLCMWCFGYLRFFRQRCDYRNFVCAFRSVSWSRSHDWFTLLVYKHSRYGIICRKIRTFLPKLHKKFDRMYWYVTKYGKHFHKIWIFHWSKRQLTRNGISW